MDPHLPRDPVVEWEKWGLFISLVTPLVLGVGAWINDALSKRKKKSDPKPEVLQGLPVDYETDYVKLLKQNLTDLRRENAELKKENKILRGRKNNGNSDNG